MRRFSFILLLAGAAALTAPATAQEKLVLSTPIYQQTGATDFRVESLYLKRAHPDAPAEIRAILREVVGADFAERGRAVVCRYDDDEAEALIVALNKANLSALSLERRIIARCQADGKLGAGSITGVPQ